MKVVNLTSVSWTLLAGEVDCYDWSGEGTPVNVLSNQQVNAGFTYDYELEPSINANRTWTMALAQNGARVGSPFRLNIPVNFLGIGPSSVFVLGGSEWGPFNRCDRVEVGPDPMQTASSDRPHLSNTTLWLWSDGTSIYAVSCARTAGAGE